MALRIFLLTGLLGFFIYNDAKGYELKIKVYSEASDQGYDVYADNREVIPITLRLKLDLTNLTPDVDHNVFVVPAGQERFLITTLAINPGTQSVRFSFETEIAPGDVPNNPPVDDYWYTLPFARNGNFKISQGYLSPRTHHGEYALDFDMKVGTPVHAIRSGIVFRVVQHHDRHCPEARCMEYNNYLIIYHEDGSFSEYAHIKKNGAAVRIGEQVKAGQLIAYSGNVGFTSGPHLHLLVYKQEFNQRISYPVHFRIDDGISAEKLVEGNHYRRNY